MTPLVRFISNLLLCFIIFWTISLGHSVTGQEVVDCDDLFRSTATQRVPCLCIKDHAIDNNGTVAVNCDSLSFFPLLPYGQNIRSYRQRYSNIRRLSEKIFDGIDKSLTHLDLSHNLLGDNLNPIFATSFLHLPALRSLNLAFNQLRAIDSSVFRGLNLTVRKASDR